jgi:UDP-N-acetylmuramate dehydrogenase
VRTDQGLQDAIAQAARLLGPLCREDVPIGLMTTYRVGGRAALFAEVSSPKELSIVAGAVSSTAVPVLVIGKGSNLLIADSGFRGLALALGAGYGELDLREDGDVVAGAAVAYPVLARRSATAGLGGMEWAVGIPGSVGGAVRMNAGGHGSETKDHLVSATVIDLAAQGAEAEERPVTGLGYAYRHSAIGSSELVLGARFRLERGKVASSQARIGEIVRWRRENQPGGQNAGSVFTNPPGDSAGRIIEALGLKGHRIGSAEVSTKHANFIQADEGGSSDDVIRLIEAVRTIVAERAGIELATEVRCIGS